MRRTIVVLVTLVALVAHRLPRRPRDDRVPTASGCDVHVHDPRRVVDDEHSFPGSTRRRVAGVVPADFTARHRVLDASDGTTRVEVRLAREGLGERTFVMRFDRAAQLTAVESVEGIPAEALGSLGLSEIFPCRGGRTARPSAAARRPLGRSTIRCSSRGWTRRRGSPAPATSCSSVSSTATRPRRSRRPRRCR